eukprot:s1382_g9.t1
MAQPGGDVEPSSLPSLESLPGYSQLPCNQCLFFASSFGCKKGDACAFCHHYVSATQANIPAQRPKNTRRRKFQDDVQELLLQLNELLLQLNVEQQGPMNVVVQLQIMAQRNRYLRVRSVGLLLPVAEKVATVVTVCTQRTPRRIRHVLERMSLANLVSMICLTLTVGLSQVEIYREVCLDHVQSYT